MPASAKPVTIGVFDSGFGGLTVLRELLPRIPNAHFVYLGDTARLPYGSKSQATIARYAVESARFLEDHAADHLVIACNTASALALPEIAAAVSIPVTGVIAPAVASTHQQHPGAEVLILATAATVHSHAYRTQCEALGLHATEKACPLLVPLVEEGWIDHPVTREVLRIYLAEALATCSPQAVILGCTHYPLLASQIQQTLHTVGSNAQVIDSALATAQAVQQALEPVLAPSPINPADKNLLTVYATDSIEKFSRLGSRFLGRPIHDVQLLDLGG
ncbi:MAG: glutamate racemase [Acidobacteriaceae bacterium]